MFDRHQPAPPAVYDVTLPELPAPWYWSFSSGYASETTARYVLGIRQETSSTSFVHRHWWHWWYPTESFLGPLRSCHVLAQSKHGKENKLTGGPVPLEEAVAIMYNACLLGVYGD
jgi:hypothetical protein